MFTKTSVREFGDSFLRTFFEEIYPINIFEIIHLYSVVALNSSHIFMWRTDFFSLKIPNSQLYWWYDLEF